MWIRIHLGPWIRRYKITDKMKGKAEFNQQKPFFSQGIILFKYEPEKSRCWCLLTATSSLNSLKLKNVLEIWWFYWPGSGLDPDWSNFVNSAGSTSLTLGALMSKIFFESFKFSLCLTVAFCENITNMRQIFFSLYDHICPILKNL